MGMAADDGILRQKSLEVLSRSLLLPPDDATSDLEKAFAEVLASCSAQRVEVAAWNWAHQHSKEPVDRPGRLYRQKIRFLAGALKRPESQRLLQKVSASEIVSRPEEDFLDEAQRQAKAKHRAEAMRSGNLSAQDGILPTK
eukprot:symbB.v1.2.006194.t1/scaffold355.1/size243294/4